MDDTPSIPDEREYLEARVYLADWQVERFLEFCEEHLKQIPDLSRVPSSELNGYKEFFELLAEQEADRLHRDIPPASRN